MHNTKSVSNIIGIHDAFKAVNIALNANQVCFIFTEDYVTNMA